MAITAMGLGTKAAPEGANLDPQRQFWSWLTPFMNPDDRTADSYHHQRAYFSGFACTQTEPAGMTIQIGGTAEADSAVLFIADGDKTKAVLLSTDGEPEVVTIPTAPASGSRIDAVVSYIDTTSPDPEGETPGTPEYIKTIVVSGTAASSPSAPTDNQIVAALPAGANSKYYRWCDVKVAQRQTTITNSNITDKKPASPNVYWTASEIEDVAKSVAPKYDYTKRQKISPPWVATADGLLNPYSFTQAGELVNVLIDGITVYSSGADTYLANRAFIPVFKGQTVTIDKTGSPDTGVFFVGQSQSS